MAGIKNGDVVKVHYTGKLKSGEVFDTSKNREPLEFKVGKGDIIPGFENNIMGMEKGQTKSFALSPDEAFGDRRDENIHVIKREQVPQNMKLEVGMQLALEGGGQGPIPATVIDMSESTVTIDTNHPLAGKDLTFEISIVDVQ